MQMRYIKNTRNTLQDTTYSMQALFVIMQSKWGLFVHKMFLSETTPINIDNNNKLIRNTPKCNQLSRQAVTNPICE